MQALQCSEVFISRNGWRGISRGSWLERHLRGVHVPDDIGDPMLHPLGKEGQANSVISLPELWVRTQLTHHTVPIIRLGCSKNRAEYSAPLPGTTATGPERWGESCPVEGGEPRESCPCSRVRWQIGRVSEAALHLHSTLPAAGLPTGTL